jgi:hypothetical protein
MDLVGLGQGRVLRELFGPGWILKTRNYLGQARYILQAGPASSMCFFSYMPFDILK